MAEIKAIHGGKIPELSVSEDLVVTLENLLADARSGALRGLAYVAVRGREDDVLTGWHGESGTRWALSGGTHILAHRYAQAEIERSEDSTTISGPRGA